MELSSYQTAVIMEIATLIVLCGVSFYSGYIFAKRKLTKQLTQQN